MKYSVQLSTGLPELPVVVTQRLEPGHSLGKSASRRSGSLIYRYACDVRPGNRGRGDKGAEVADLDAMGRAEFVGHEQQLLRREGGRHPRALLIRDSSSA